MTLDVDRAVLGDRAGLLLPGDRPAVRARDRDRATCAPRGRSTGPRRRSAGPSRYCCTDLACSTCEPAAVNRSEASASACRAAGSSLGSSAYTCPPSRSTQRRASACESSSDRAPMPPRAGAGRRTPATTIAAMITIHRSESTCCPFRYLSVPSWYCCRTDNGVAVLSGNVSPAGERSVGAADRSVSGAACGCRTPTGRAHRRATCPAIS